MSTAPIRIAVAGAGVFGRNHLRVIKENPHALLAGVYDIDRDRAAAAAGEFGCPSFNSIEELASHANAAVVAVPTSAHADVACELIDRGVDVLVEKPFAQTEGDARRVIDAASTHGRIVQVGHLERFNPAVRALRGLLTKPLFFEIHRLSVFSPRSLDISVVGDLMIHDLDILLSMTGAMPEEVRAAGINILSDRVDIANVRLAFPGGVIANLTSSRVSTERVRKLRVFQPGQYISVDYAKQECFLLSVNPATRQILPAPQPVEHAEPLKLQFEAFLKSIESRSRPEVDGEAALRALILARDILAKIEEHAAVVAQSLRR